MHVSVAAVSKALKKQERAIGVELFARDSRNVRLTPVGEQLRDDLRQLHQGLTQSLERARLAALRARGASKEHARREVNRDMPFSGAAA
ncbi:LysR family transcriptional regulator [Nonomuraea sp. SYSU D8015]|uniref:LysR family transcriptional regulator n=1 Tax=Nonomuraea sp. SYSU D8015 TaxID=2593644 RepID=UPI0021CF77DE|nr:LysR family transcriptional regulator [Nonomuraea sp. SYSU D8015]